MQAVRKEVYWCMQEKEEVVLMDLGQIKKGGTRVLQQQQDSFTMVVKQFTNNNIDLILYSADHIKHKYEKDKSWCFKRNEESS